VCDYGGDGFDGLNSIIVLLDEESEQRMQAFVKGIETAMQQAGTKLLRNCGHLV
jgi:hypothetical protein